MTALLIVLALVAGVLLTVQVGVNGVLAQLSSGAIWAAWVSVTVSSLSLLLVLLVARVPWPSLSAVAAAPWWSWTGGAMGGFIVAVSVFAGPKLGALALFGLIVTGQIIAAITADHFGALIFPETPISLMRVVGAVLLVVGVFLVQRF